jgi:propionyl-CoA carboxylase alpha chain
MIPITKLLIANRGEIVSRVIRTARQLDIGTVAVFSDPDAGAPYVAQADESVRLPGESPADTYLRIDRIIAAAQTTGADAVHPGYGFLSERADFAEACAEAGIVFVGPPASAIDAMGSKITAKALMASAGVPVLPGITIEDEEIDASIGDRAAKEIGFPLLVKAAYGGGGRGMRVVHSADELADAVAGAQREATAAFGNGSVFMEHFVESPRHIEVQIFGDAQGSVVHLFERECSIQRRYQKIIEEAPSSMVNEALRTELGAAAVAAGKAIGYVGAGTVEFVVDASGRFYFLEVNARLQVEHPVTELVTGLDLVALQLLVAEGHPLPPDVMSAKISGHAIEARLYAEDTNEGFLPATGTIRRFVVPELPGVRVDAGVAEGSIVGIHYDPMLAKVIAHGRDRQEAARRLSAALARTQLHGITSNRELLIGILRETEFSNGQIDTGYLSRHDPVILSQSRQHPDEIAVHALAAALAGQAERRAAAAVLPGVPSGWRNVVNEPQRATFSCGGENVEVRYRVGLKRSNAYGDTFAQIDDRSVDGVILRDVSPTRVDLDFDGVRRMISIDRIDAEIYVDSSLGSTSLLEEKRFPEPGDLQATGSLLAPMPGTVARIAAEVGQIVAKGAVLVVLEAMKMEHFVEAPHDGTITAVGVKLGQSVDVGTVLAVLETDAEESG